MAAREKPGPVLSAELMEAIYAYLITRPYVEVGGLVQALNASFDSQAKP